MKAIISCCGMRCDLCLAFQPNIEAHPENRKLISDGWHTYFGFRIPPEKIFCSGCFSGGSPTIDSECPVHPCVSARGLHNCAECESYICDKLNKILVTFETIQAKFDHAIPELDRQRFIFPYENKNRLAALRRQNNSAGLSKG